MTALAVPFRVRLAGLLTCAGLATAGCLPPLIVIVPMIPPVELLAPSPRQALDPGTTSRTDVLMAMGSPDSRHHDDRYFVYGWIQVYAAGTAGAGSSGEVLWDSHRLILKFDADGRLVERAEVSAFQSTRADTKARRWIETAEGVTQ